MKISVIIPVFNGINFLSEAISSLLQQTYKDFEVIIVDDASTEDIFQFINNLYVDEIACGKIRFFRNSTNMERCYSRNFGIDKAVGDVITFLDHDDRFKENHLLLINELFQDKAVEVVYSIPEELIDYRNSIVCSLPSKLNKEDLISSAVLGCFCVIGFSFRRNTLCEIGKFNLNTIQREDYELACRAIIKHRLAVKVVNSNSIQIRRVKSDTSLSGVLKPDDPYLQFSKIAHQIVEDYILSSKESQKYLPVSYIEIMNTAISFNDYNCALAYLSKFFLKRPLSIISIWLLGRLIKQIAFRLFRLHKSAKI